MSREFNEATSIESVVNSEGEEAGPYARGEDCVSYTLEGFGLGFLGLPGDEVVVEYFDVVPGLDTQSFHEGLNLVVIVFEGSSSETHPLISL